MCEHPKRGAREAAAVALSGTTDATALAALVRLCEDPGSNVRWHAVGSLRSAPRNSGVAQRLLSKRWDQECWSEIQDLLFARLLPDHVPFAEWPEG